jgi:hypothetical protein
MRFTQSLFSRLQFLVFQQAASDCAFTQYLDATWTVTVNGQSVQVNADGSFLIPNVSAPDQFGAGGPGTPRNFLSDDFVRLIGVGTKDGVTKYFFIDFLELAKALRSPFMMSLSPRRRRRRQTC